VSDEGRWVETSNKQLDFLQRVAVMLKSHGRAAVVLPDNVLFESGVAGSIRRRLLEEFDVHTLLRLPRGLFYAQGVSANVLFFERTPRERRSNSLWVYDLRTNNHFSLRTNPLSDGDLRDFVASYKGKRIRASRTDRWRDFDRDSILATNECSLNISWRAEADTTSSSGSRLEEISLQIAEDLHKALTHIVRVSGR
jgi:type I restriction enzyme M protein